MCPTKARLIDFVAHHRTYVAPGHHQTCVTITESLDNTVFPVVLAGSCTADMIFITMGGIFCTHPRLLLAQISMRGYPCSVVSDDFTSRFYAKQFMVLDDTADLQGKCGNLCPLLWQSVEHGNLMMRVNWSLSRDGSEDTNGSSHIGRHTYWWRLNDQCYTQRCRFRHHNFSVTRRAVVSEEQIEVTH